MKKIVFGIVVGIVMIACVAVSYAWIDYQCQSDCLNAGYSWGYCQRVCSY